jgi:hypothetical protein
MQKDLRSYRLNFHREGRQSYHTIVDSDVETKNVRVHVDQDQGEPAASTEACLPDAALCPVRYPLDLLLLMNHLASSGGVIVHGAGMVIRERAVVCLGESGAGKSTLSQLFMDEGLGDSLLSDDRVILRRSVSKDQATASAGRGQRVEDEEIGAWGTPWPGDAGVARNASAPLGALLFLVKATTNELRPLSPRVAARRLMPVVTCPWYDPDRLPGVLETCSHVVENTPCFELLFRADAGVVEYLANVPWTRKGGSS